MISMSNIGNKLNEREQLTLKAPITIAADDFCLAH